MHIQSDRAFVPAGAPTVRYLQVLISAPPQSPAAAAARPPVSVALVLDRSGSMAGSKIDMARAAVDHAVRLLKPTDYLAVVCYDEEITTVLDRTLASSEAKTLAHQRLAAIDARGATNLYGGWTFGSDLARCDLRMPTAPGAVSKVMLLTDGLANRGVTEPAELVATARRTRALGVATSTFGVGADFDEELLSRIATEGGGHFYFIEKAQQIPDVFASELGETLEVVARDAVFEVACDPGVEAMVLNGLPVERVEGLLRVPLGNLIADQEITLIVAVAFKGSQSEGVTLGVHCRVEDRDHVLYPEPIGVSWRAVAAAEDAAQPANTVVRRAVATMLAGRARAAALAANRHGDFEGAMRILRGIVDDLRAVAPGDKQVQALIDQLHHDERKFGETMAPMAMKAQYAVLYQEAHSREAGGTARKTNRSR